MDNATTRRSMLKATAAGSMLGLAGCAGNSDGEYPSDDIKLIIPFGAGGGTDTALRNIMPSVSEDLGVNIQIENIPGGASLRGTGEGFNSEPDGYTMQAFNPPSTPISALINEPGFDLRELTGIGVYGTSPYTMVANPEYGFDDLEDVVSQFEEGRISSLAGQAVGGPLYVLSVLIQEWLPWENYLPYDGSGDIIQAVISGEAPIGFTTPSEIAQPVEDGRLDFICYMSSTTTPAFPNSDTITDFGFENIDFVAQLTRCLYFPPNTSQEKVEIMYSALESAMNSDAVQNWAADVGFSVNVAGPEVAEEVIQDIYETIPQVVNLEDFRD